MPNSEEPSNEPILYELLEYFVRKQEPELIKSKNDAVLSTSGTIKNALKYLNNRYSLPESISRQVSLTLPWKFAVGDSGRLLALSQENVIEIRKAKDEYSSIVGKASVPKDAFPQWRKLSWSPDASILVLASSNGYTSFYNALGNNIFNITPKNVLQNPNILEAGDAIASMIFLKPRTKSDKWSYEFLLITYSGLLRSYHISPTNGFEHNYEFSFGNFYKNGVNAAAYDDKHSLLYVSGNVITQKITSTASENGLTSWRPLNDYPYYKLSFTFADEAKTGSGFSIWNIIPGLNFEPKSIVFKARICPNSEYLTCLHTDGTISLWKLPNLVLQKKWKLSEQPDYNVQNPLGSIKSKRFPPGVTEFHPLDIGWWSDQAIIIARYSGSTSVCSMNNLKNLLGTSPEFLAGHPQICELGPDHGFLCLDCETLITTKKRTRDTNSDGQLSEASSESEKEDDELEPISILNYTTNIIQGTLYSITDIERFQPKRKKSKVLFRTYRILGLKSTTPEELYSRKIDIEEYDEALALAKTYNLDTDLVYQTQWRKSELSLNAIQEHLRKVTKRSWVLHECVTRVPDTIEAARELLNFGLKGANLETLLAISVSDNGKFVVDSADEEWEDIDDSSVSLRQVQKINELLDRLDIQNLSDAQKDLIRYRKKLLDHLDKLLTYEIILGSPEKYDKKFYEDFRQFSAVENAIRFAKDSDCRGVEIMFTYYGESLLPHWLTVISFFPETLCPTNYEKLVPECDVDGQLFLPDQRELRQKDWSEKAEFSDITYSDTDDTTEQLYEDDPSLAIYRNTELTMDLLQKWYKSRAYEIERNSWMVDNALQLIKIGKSHNIIGLEDLLLDLEVLDDLVYKVGLEDLTLDRLEKQSNLDKIKLLMSAANEKTFVDNIKHLLLPLIKRRHDYLGGDLQRHLLSDYLVYLSKEDLQLPVKLFEHLKQTQDPEILHMIDDTAALALDCIYACEDSDMYQKAKSILDSIPRDRTAKRTGGISTMLEELERELDSVKILNKYNVKTTLSHLRKKKSDPDAAKLLLIQMARSLNKMMPPADEKVWSQMLNDMLEIHGMIFSCVDIEICFEICVSARLVSGIKSNIKNCASLIETKKNEQSLLKVSYEKAVHLILEASKEYFNSSKSLTDPNMELAKACLHLIVDENPRIKEECELIYSLQILNEFSVDILPLQVRLMQDKLKLVQDCLNKREDAHKSRQRLLTLANYLRVEGNNTRSREGKVLELIAKRALEVKDYNVCAAICQQLIQSSYIPAWTVALNLGYCDEYQDLKVRQKCLWFAISNGPSEILANALQQTQLIEIQMLNKSLELWIPSEEFQDANDEDDDDEFTDAMTTPQVETKEFVPKVLETSSEIVKTSANLVKQSTFGLIKNISDTNFWKSRLKFNFAAETVKGRYTSADSEMETIIEKQGFPCFYESLHDHCRLSELDTSYTNYSMPDAQNTKLKCCRALLRINMLSESACYGTQVSDINHLFLECAKYTLAEDWLLGLSYLLSLSKRCIPEAQNVFKVLPNTDLYAQTAAYFYSLELHRLLYPDSNDIYLYSPSYAVHKMLNAPPNAEVAEVQECLRYWKNSLMSAHKTEKSASPTQNEDEQNKSVETFDNSIKNEERTDFSPALENEAKEIKQEQENFTADFHAVQTKIEAGQDAGDNASVKDEVEWTDDWGDFSMDTDTDTVETLLLGLTKNATEETRFKAFNEAFLRIRSIEDVHLIRNTLLEWEEFDNPDYTTLENHPVLKLMRILPQYVLEPNKPNTDSQILQEYRQLMKGIFSIDLLKEFVITENDQIPLECGLYIRLNTDDLSLHQEAVDIIKSKHKSIKFSPSILEGLFLNDLTACFEPRHEVYRQIIQHVYMNRAIPDVKEHSAILARELRNRKHIAQAVYIVTQMEDIPPCLSTFDTCYELLKKL